MPKLEEKIPPKTWTKPEVRRIMSGAAEFGGDTSVDGSGNFS
jgi:hypothetical protein